MRFLNEVAEIRRAKETAEFFDALSPADQHEWVKDLLDRTTPMRPMSASSIPESTGVTLCCAQR